jgi:hypothetical protein
MLAESGKMTMHAGDGWVGRRAWLNGLDPCCKRVDWRKLAPLLMLDRDEMQLLREMR